MPNEFDQAVSNAIAGGVSAPVDLLAWLLRKGGVSVEKPVLGSEWMREKGLTREVPQSAASIGGETVGSLVDPLGSAGAASKAMIILAARLKQADTVASALRKGKFSEGTIFQSTGTYRDAGGKKAKAILADDTAKVTPILDNAKTFEEMRLPEALDHPALYELYPELAKTTVSRDSGFRAAFVPRYNHIRIGDSLDGEQLRSSMLHEIQHAVQKADKTQSGGDPFFIAGDLGVPYEQAQKIYAKLPGEQEARFTEATKNMNQRQLNEEVVKLLRAGKSPANQY